ncbi:hypothetical protein E2542_SST18653 [Spatholobus suberectus]|nr:hypothetical protein E2542_SST18653 [Spatholobus suberectus]
MFLSSKTEAVAASGALVACLYEGLSFVVLMETTSLPPSRVALYTLSLLPLPKKLSAEKSWAATTRRGVIVVLQLMNEEDCEGNDITTFSITTFGQ